MPTTLRLLTLCGLVSACEVTADVHGWSTSTAQFLELELMYDANAVPPIAVTGMTAKAGTARGVVPPPVPDATFRIDVLDADGLVIYSEPFGLPNFVEDPPPLEGDRSASGELLDRLSFAFNLPWFDGADSLSVVDPSDLSIASHALVDVHPAEAVALPPSTGLTLAASSSMLDIVLIGDGYTSADLPRFRADAERFKAKLLSIEPFRSRAAQLAVHVVDNTVSLGCSYSGRLIVCNNSTVVSRLNTAGVGYDKIGVIVNNATYGGSGGSTVAVAYNGDTGDEVFVHELGHSLGLVDEYVLYSGGSLDGNVHANCFAGDPPATAWTGLASSASLFLGCNYAAWYRSTDNSVMRTLSSFVFNPVSLQILGQSFDRYAPLSLSDTSAPTASITSPASGSTVSGQVAVAITATDDRGVARVELYRDGAQIGSDSTSPFSIAWATSGDLNGTHTLRVRAYDLAGNAGDSPTVTVTSSNGVDTTLPAVSITSPSAGSIVTGLVTVRVTATDNSGSVARVELYKNGVLLGATSSAPFELTWATDREVNGSVTLVARAIDPSGNRRDSAPVTVTTSNLADTTPPTVIIESPSAGAQLNGGWLKISAVAYDASGLSRLQLAIDGIVVQTCAAARCAYSMQVKTLSAGLHTVSASATDSSSAGNTTTRSTTVRR